ncbi:1,4-dihydroxy-2-naphthoate octaprenyltransferase [candidate division KSB1 bacterium]|nr:1,4-dihydroxy-2-naphthoate octaprenyltransferase [candidate division KSB1 bacterium]
MRRKILLLLKELRAPFFTAVIVPTILGLAIAINHGLEINWVHFILTLFGVIFLHAGTNIANDYFDHKSGNDEANNEYARPFTGGSRLIQNNELKPREVLSESLFFYVLGAAIGLYFIFTVGIGILILGFAGVFIGYFYTAPPFRLVYHGLGELAVGVSCGILVTFGAYYVQAGHFSWEPVTAGIPIGFLIAAVLWINEFQDYHADKSVGKKHWVVRMGRQKAEKIYRVIMFAAYLVIVVASVAGWISIFALIGLVTLPITVKAIKIASREYDNPRQLVGANAATISTHFLTGLLLSLGYMLEHFLV